MRRYAPLPNRSHCTISISAPVCASLPSARTSWPAWPPIRIDSELLIRTSFIGGSPFNVTDPESTKTDVQRRLEADVERIAAGVMAAPSSSSPAALFTCYSIGILTRLLGGEVSRGYPEDTGPVSVDLTTDGERDPLLGTLAHRFTALTAHKEGSARVPDGATLLATNDACPVQAYRVGERLYATQFHPEPTPKAFTERMAVYRDDGYFPANDYDTVAGRVLAASVTEPVRLIRAFARAFGPA